MASSTDSSIGIGTVLQETYEIVSLLGQGGMGAVFLARHRRLPGKQVAVKVLRANANLPSEFYARFRREAEIASKLGHPHIVEVLDFDTHEDGSPFLIMEYLRGESLERRLKRGPLSLASTLTITRQIGSALQAAHRTGIIHRDLKPANVFLVSEPGGTEQARLLDFGISKIIDSQTLQTQENVLLGTPQYMSPEQAMGRNSEIDARTDLFALGCMVYEMLSGVSPFGGGGSTIQIVRRIVKDPPTPLLSRCPELPLNVVAAVERALAKEPQDRYPDIEAFITELTGEPLPALPAGAEPPESSRPAQTARPPSGPVSTPAPTLPMSNRREASSSAASTKPSGRGSAPRAAAEETRIPTPVAQPPPTLPLGQVAQPLSSAPTVAPARPTPAGLMPAESSSAPARPRWPLAVGAVVALLGVAAAGWWLGSRARAPAPAAPAAVAPPPTSAPPVAAAATPEPAPPAPEAAPPAPEPATPAPRPPLGRDTGERLPENVRKLLEEAEAALEAGNTAEALRLAQRSQKVGKPSAAALSLLTRASCQGKRLADSRKYYTQLTRYVSTRKLPTPVLGEVREYCKQLQIKL